MGAMQFLSQYVKVAEVKEIPPGSIKVIPGIDRVSVCLINLEGNYFAISGVCPHKGGPLYKGILRSKSLVCPWHNAGFRVDTGKHTWPAQRDLRTFEVKIEGDSVLIKRSD